MDHYEDFHTDLDELGLPEYIIAVCHDDGLIEHVLTFEDEDEARKALRDAQASQLVEGVTYKLILRRTFYGEWEV